MRGLGAALCVLFLFRSTIGWGTGRGLAKECLPHCWALMRGRLPERHLPADDDPGRSIGALPASSPADR